MAKHIPRIYCNDLSESELFKLPEFQVAHLVSVFRMKRGDHFVAFNDRVGEWFCSIEYIKKGEIIAKKLELKRTFHDVNRLSLAVCPIKPDNFKLVIEKGTELGVTDFYIINSEYTNAKFNIDKLKLISIFSAEQSERIDIPVIHDSIRLDNFLDNLPPNFLWISAIEREDGHSSLADIDLRSKDIGFIIGPEGGFSDIEKEKLNKKTTTVTISKNILRAETAAITCLAIYNSKNC